MTKTKDALKIIDSITGNDKELRELIGQARVNEELAQLIYDARIKAGLTQKELAELIGTKQPVIARLEDADYTGHSLFMLQKIANALNQRLEIRLRPVRPRSRLGLTKLAG
jgi:ribosome-binding protein aMBF1 (putative translation factor)